MTTPTITRKLAIPAALILSWCTGAAADPAPTWFHEHIAELTADSGVWLADNSAYQSEQEPADHYALHWRYGIGKQSAIGRLYSLVDGKEAGTHWEFRLFWHPAEDQALLLQYGAGGAVLEGPMRIEADGSERLQQTMHMPDGSRMEVGHRTTHPEAGVQIGSSFDIDAEGNWKPRRSYTWRRQPAVSASQ